MTREMPAAAGRCLQATRRIRGAARQRPASDVQPGPRVRCDMPSCAIAVIGITQATEVLAFDFRPRYGHTV